MSAASAAEDAATGSGGCLCGAVRYVLRGPLRPVIACHCMQCRRQSGHFVAATAVMRPYLVLIRDDGLRWFQSSVTARRGFCGHCGSTLFWDSLTRPHVSIMAGTLDAPTGVTVAAHIFTDAAGDYYRIEDGLPCHAGGDAGIPTPE